MFVGVFFVTAELEFGFDVALSYVEETDAWLNLSVCLVNGNLGEFTVTLTVATAEATAVGKLSTAIWPA